MNPLEAVEATLVLLRTRPLQRRPDGLNHWADLQALLQGCGLGIQARVPLDVDEEVQTVADARRMRDALAVAMVAGSAEAALELLHELMASQELDPSPDTGHGRGYPPGSRGRPIAAVAAVLLPTLCQAVIEGVLQRVRICPDAVCQTVFLDPARGRPQRYCSPRCGTRARMRRHRSREAAQL